MNMNNPWMALLQSLLMVGGSVLVGAKVGNGTISPSDVQTIGGSLLAIGGAVLNHFSAKQATS